MYLILSVFFVSVIGVLFCWQNHHFNYWRRKGITSIPTIPFFGNVKNLLLLRCGFGDQFKEFYDSAKSQNEPFVGIHVLHNRAILLRDTEIIKNILIKDFGAFASRFESTDPFGDSMGSLNLFFAKYDIWKDIHTIFSPLFAHGKLKKMCPLLQQIGEKLELHLSRLNFDADSNSTIVEVKHLAALFTTDTIASLAFGIDANSLENPKSQFRQMCLEVNDPRPKRLFHLFTMFFLPQWVELVAAHLYSSEYEHFMRTSVEYAVSERERSGTTRNDLIDIFIKIKRQALQSQGSVVNRPDFFVAQAAFLLLAGFDTSSSTIMFALYELAKNPNIQKRLHAELTEIMEDHNRKLDYEIISNMQYLRMVVDEVLRLYPPTAFLDRCCTKTEGYQLLPWSTYKIPKGMPVYISVLGLHRDEKLWQHPNKFDPERFTTENRKAHHSMSYLPFGSGPRGCIGSLLGLLQVKMGLIYILKNYEIKTCSRTQEEMKFDPKAFVLTAHGGMFLKFIKHKKQYKPN